MAYYKEALSKARDAPYCVSGTRSAVARNSIKKDTHRHEALAFRLLIFYCDHLSILVSTPCKLICYPYPPLSN